MPDNVRWTAQDRLLLSSIPAAGQDLLRQIEASWPRPNASWVEWIMSMYFIPPSWNPFHQSRSISTSTSGSSTTLETAIASRPGSQVTLDLNWVQGDLSSLLAELGDQPVPPTVPSFYGVSSSILLAWDHRFTDEASVLWSIITQINLFIPRALSPLFSQIWPGCSVFITGSPAGPDSHGNYGRTTPDFEICQEYDNAGTHETLVSVEGKMATVMPLLVMRWIIWWARRRYLVTPTADLPATPGLSRDSETRRAQHKALLVIRQIWGQRACKETTRLILTNGDHWLYIRAVRTGRTRPSAPNAVDIAFSRIYAADGTADTYDGSHFPTDTPIPPNDLPRAPSQGTVCAITFAAAKLKRAVDASTPSRISTRMRKASQRYSASPSAPTLTSGSSASRANQRRGARAKRASGPHDKGSGKDSDTSQTQVSVFMPEKLELKGLHCIANVLFQNIKAYHPTQPGQLLLVPVAARLALSESVESFQSSPSVPKVLSAIEIDIRRYLSHGSLADVFSANIRATTSASSASVFPAAIKLCRSATFEPESWACMTNAGKDDEQPYGPEDAIEALRREGHLTAALASTGAVPEVFFGFECVDVLGKTITAIALEELGESAEDACLTESDCAEIESTLTRIHDAGYVHGDVELRHFLRRKSKGWAVIDLERAKVASTERNGDLLRRREMGSLRYFLKSKLGRQAARLDVGATN